MAAQLSSTATPRSPSRASIDSCRNLSPLRLARAASCWPSSTGAARCPRRSDSPADWSAADTRSGCWPIRPWPADAEAAGCSFSPWREAPHFRSREEQTAVVAAFESRRPDPRDQGGARVRRARNDRTVRPRCALHGAGVRMRTPSSRRARCPGSSSAPWHRASHRRLDGQHLPAADHRIPADGHGLVTGARAAGPGAGSGWLPRRPGGCWPARFPGSTRCWPNTDSPPLHGAVRTLRPVRPRPGHDEPVIRLRRPATPGQRQLCRPATRRPGLGGSDPLAASRHRTARARAPPARSTSINPTCCGGQRGPSAACRSVAS